MQSSKSTYVGIYVSGATIFDTRISDLSVNWLNCEHIMLKHREVSTPRNRVNILKLRAVSESKHMIYLLYA